MLWRIAEDGAGLPRFPVFAARSRTLCDSAESGSCRSRCHAITSSLNQSFRWGVIACPWGNNLSRSFRFHLLAHVGGYLLHDRDLAVGGGLAHLVLFDQARICASAVFQFPLGAALLVGGRD
jgi:hypothetical protein